ncbi:3-methyladenine DNA glycosylase AlkD [Treponema rectale]|uniref:3-methyladenine DNA glycosylase AlkD n=1 Tax=Treponema rectale TaxID=744512 RepID=A0A840S8C3_9SPIR|nr:DNA alkylation repair protein [Treponema rectale]MBB5218879.1 3-methyladenine DNA glycosylase AlkD [Treponema rectale]
MTNEQIVKHLFSLQDKKFREFHLKLIPGIETDKVIGVRTPVLRKFAKEIIKAGSGEEFLSSLPHYYYEENQLHSFILSEEKDFDNCIKYVDKFLPYINNWATCDQLLPKVFKKQPQKLLPHINLWIESGETYKIRFAIGMLMQHFLDVLFEERFAQKVASVHSEEYYVKMMQAWYFATALAKQYESAVKYLEEKKLESWTHNKTIQKAIESFRVPDERKEYLRTLKV